jgi:membrane protein YqaA with SNARE-associated domain
MWVGQVALVFVAAAVSASILPGTTELAIAAAILGLELQLFGTAVAMQAAPPVLVVGAAIAGAVFGSAIQWAIGRYLADFRHHKRFPLKEEQYQRYSLWFQRYGVWALGMAWLPGLGDVLTLIGGLFRTPFLLSMTLVGVAKGARFALAAAVILGAAPWAARLFEDLAPGAGTRPASEHSSPIEGGLHGQEEQSG